jgi:hypothetical protein
MEEKVLLEICAGCVDYSFAKMMHGYLGRQQSGLARAIALGGLCRQVRGKNYRPRRRRPEFRSDLAIYVE